MAFVNVSLFSFCHCICCKNTITFWTRPKHTLSHPIAYWETAHLYVTLCHTCSKHGQEDIHGCLIAEERLRGLINAISGVHSAPQMWKRGRDVVCTDLRVIMTILPH